MFAGNELEQNHCQAKNKDRHKQAQSPNRHSRLCFAEFFVLEPRNTLITSPYPHRVTKIVLEAAMSRDPDPGDRTQVDSPEGKTRIVGTRALKHNEFIYDFTDAETEYWEALQDDEKNDFYQFAIGLKLKHPWDDKAKKSESLLLGKCVSWQ